MTSTAIFRYQQVYRHNYRCAALVDTTTLNLRFFLHKAPAWAWAEPGPDLSLVPRPGSWYFKAWAGSSRAIAGAFEPSQALHITSSKPYWVDSPVSVSANTPQLASSFIALQLVLPWLKSHFLLSLEINYVKSQEYFNNNHILKSTVDVLICTNHQLRVLFVPGIENDITDALSWQQFSYALATCLSLTISFFEPPQLLLEAVKKWLPLFLVLDNLSILLGLENI